MVPTGSSTWSRPTGPCDPRLRLASGGRTSDALAAVCLLAHSGALGPPAAPPAWVGPEGGAGPEAGGSVQAEACGTPRSLTVMGPPSSVSFVPQTPRTHTHPCSCDSGRESSGQPASSQPWVAAEAGGVWEHAGAVLVCV